MEAGRRSHEVGVKSGRSDRATVASGARETLRLHGPDGDAADLRCLVIASALERQPGQAPPAVSGGQPTKACCCRSRRSAGIGLVGAVPLRPGSARSAIERYGLTPAPPRLFEELVAQDGEQPSLEVGARLKLRPGRPSARTTVSCTRSSAADVVTHEEAGEGAEIGQQGPSWRGRSRQLRRIHAADWHASRQAIDAVFRSRRSRWSRGTGPAPRMRQWAHRVSPWRGAPGK